MSGFWIIAGFAIAPIAGCILLVFFRLLDGRINLYGLLAGKETGAFTVGRLQMLIAVISVLLLYLAEVLRLDHQPMVAYGFYTLPDPQVWLEGAAGASGGAYLFAKFLPGSFGRTPPSNGTVLPRK